MTDISRDSDGGRVASGLGMPPSRQALYEVIKQDITELISCGELNPGDLLPKREELADRYQTTRATVARAMQELEREGLIVGGSGRRTTVRAPSSPTVTSIAVVWSAPASQISEGDEYVSALFSGVRDSCARHMLQVHFRCTGVESYGGVLTQTSAQGLLVVRPEYGHVTELERMRAQGIPLVAVPGIPGDPLIPSVSSDNLQGVDLAVDHLVTLGHRDIGFVTLTATFPDHFLRLQGFIRAMQRHNLGLDPAWICLRHSQDDDQYLRHTRKWIGVHRLPTAILAGDFKMALSTLRALNEAGLKVPQDVSLVCFDDSPLASHMIPAMTVVRQPTSQLGYQSVERLMRLIRGEEITLAKRLPTELIVRESTAAPHGAIGTA